MSRGYHFGMTSTVPGHGLHLLHADKLAVGLGFHRRTARDTTYYLDDQMDKHD